MTANDRDDTASRRQVIAGLAAGAAMVAPRSVRAGSALGITRNVDAIHEEVSFKAPPGRVYTLLTDEREFQKVFALGGAGTLLKFDHSGFTASDAEDLAQGWESNYWRPMATVLAQP